MMHRDFTTRQVETLLNNTIPTDAALHADEKNRIVAVIHTLTTGCNLTAEDFAGPADWPCADGGSAEHHLSSTDRIEVP